jgi:hypothetical protein
MQIATVLLVAVAACSRAPSRSDERAAAPPPAPVTPTTSRAAAAVPTAKVYLQGAPGEKVVTVEVVQSSGLVQKGLMYRKHLPPEAGMLFLMGDDDDHTFWMKNTLIPLDIMFIDASFTVVGVLENMQPHDEVPKGVGKPSRYVLEVNAGWSKANGVGAGTRVRFEGVEAAAR